MSNKIKEFRDAIDKIFSARVCNDSEDLGVDDQHIESAVKAGENPESFCDRWIYKYDLIERRDFF